MVILKPAIKGNVNVKNTLRNPIKVYKAVKELKQNIPGLSSTDALKMVSNPTQEFRFNVTTDTLTGKITLSHNISANNYKEKIQDLNKNEKIYQDINQRYKEFVGDGRKIFDIDFLQRKAESDPEGSNRFLEKVEEALKDPSIDPRIKQHVEKTVVNPLKIGIGVSVITITQTGKNQQGITMNIKNVVLNDPFKRGVINMARREGISRQTLDKLMNMEPEKLHILYDANSSFFDEYFKYPEEWYDTGFDDYFTGDVGYQDVIDLYERTFGVTL